MKSAFTLIELLLAIALSTILILVAVTTFRGVTEAMSTIEDITEENRLMRSGIFMGLADADFWHSEANPAFPYHRAHMSQNVDGNNIDDLRPFRPITWSDNTDDAENVNWSLPHDPRSWYRNHLRTNVVSGMLLIEGFDDPVSYFNPDFPEEGEFLVFRSVGGDIDGGEITTPQGWAPWHIVGDYAAVSNCENLNSDGMRNDRPVRMWYICQNLGQLGMYAYCNAGEITQFQVSSRNEILEHYSEKYKGGKDIREHRADYHWCKGEIPWSLHASQEVGVNKKIEILGGARDLAKELGSYPGTFATEFPNHNRQNWALMLPTYFEGVREERTALRRHAYCADFGIYNTDVPTFSLSRSLEETATPDKQPLSPLALFFPPNPKPESYGSDSYDMFRFYNYVRNPSAILDIARVGSLHEGNKMKSYEKNESHHLTHYKDMREAHSRTTRHIPQAPTDHIAFNAGSHEGGTLSSNIYRYQYNNGDHCYVTITVGNKKGEVAFQCTFKVLSTSYRGGRQYWGRLSKQRSGIADGLGNTFMIGDIYE